MTVRSEVSAFRDGTVPDDKAQGMLWVPEAERGKRQRKEKSPGSDKPVKACEWVTDIGSHSHLKGKTVAGARGEREIGIGCQSHQF